MPKARGPLRGTVKVPGAPGATSAPTGPTKRGLVQPAPYSVLAGFIGADAGSHVPRYTKPLARRAAASPVSAPPVGDGQGSSPVFVRVTVCGIVSPGCSVTANDDTGAAASLRTSIMK